MATAKKTSKEVADAQAAKKKADPDTQDPSFMPNIEPQTGGKAPKTSSKAVPRRKSPAKASAPKVGDTVPKDLRLPNLPATDDEFQPNAQTVEVSPSKPNRGSTVRLDPPSVRLVPGNSVTFVADEGDGRVQAKITTARGSVLVTASNGHGDARVSKILETNDEIVVEFFDDGKKYASGTFKVG